MMKHTALIKFAPAFCGIASWILVALYITSPHPQLHLDAVFGAYKTARRIGETSLSLAGLGCIICALQAGRLRRGSVTLIVGAALCLSALAMNMFGVPI